MFGTNGTFYTCKCRTCIIRKNYFERSMVFQNYFECLHLNAMFKIQSQCNCVDYDRISTVICRKVFKIHNKYAKITK